MFSGYFNAIEIVAGCAAGMHCFADWAAAECCGTHYLITVGQVVLSWPDGAAGAAVSLCRFVTDATWIDKT